MASEAPKLAILYRMVMTEHLCPYGLKSKHLLHREGYRIEDHWLTTREQTDSFKTLHGVKTTPQTFIGGSRIGGYDDLRRYFGKPVQDPKAVTYRPVMILLAMTALMAAAISYASLGLPITWQALQWFIAFSMCVLALQKLEDVESFSSMFLGYDLLKTVYIDRRTLKCACVGGDSNVPLGIVSLIENLMMVGMALWMCGKSH